MSVAHKVFDDKWNHIDTVSFEENDESDGTRNFLKILWPILDTLDNGRILLVDEFNTSLHPLLCEFIIDL